MFDMEQNYSCQIGGPPKANGFRLLWHRDYFVLGAAHNVHVGYMYILLRGERKVS